MLLTMIFNIIMWVGCIYSVSLKSAEIFIAEKTTKHDPRVLLRVKGWAENISPAPYFWLSTSKLLVLKRDSASELATTGLVRESVVEIDIKSGKEHVLNDVNSRWAKQEELRLWWSYSRLTNRILWQGSPFGNSQAGSWVVCSPKGGPWIVGQFDQPVTQGLFSSDGKRWVSISSVAHGGDAVMMEFDLKPDAVPRYIKILPRVKLTLAGMSLRPMGWIAPRKLLVLGKPGVNGRRNPCLFIIQTGSVSASIDIIPVSLPSGSALADTEISPDAKWIAWLVLQYNSAQYSDAQSAAIWLCDQAGNEWREVTSFPIPRAQSRFESGYPEGLHWLPDDRSVSFLMGRVLMAVTVLQ